MKENKTALQWIKEFDVTDLREIKDTPEFKSMISPKFFKDVAGYYICKHSGLLIIISGASRYGFNRVNGHCLFESTIFPAK